MVDLIQMQADIFGAISSHAPLKSVNVVSQRRMLLAGEVNMATIYETVRNGKGGAGVLVEMPVGENRRPNVSGPTLDWVFPVTYVEAPEVNMASPTGTQIPAEDGIQMVMDCMHLHADESLGTLEAQGFAVVEDFPGCVAYRARFRGIIKNAQTVRTGTVTIAIAGGSCTLSCAGDPAATIFYTLDGTFPANQDGGNPSSLAYAAPFAVESGDVVRAAAWADGKLGSEIRRSMAP